MQLSGLQQAAWKLMLKPQAEHGRDHTGGAQVTEELGAAQPLHF
jgi:hypothetical protein